MISYVYLNNDLNIQKDRIHAAFEAWWSSFQIKKASPHRPHLEGRWCFVLLQAEQMSKHYHALQNIKELA